MTKRGGELPPNQIEFFPFAGGLDLTSPPLTVRAGMLFDCVNYESNISGGYSRVLGYEAFDGHPRPSDQVYQGVGCTLTQTPAPGTVLTVGAVTCTFVQAVAGGIIVYAASGIVPVSTAIMAGATQVGTTNAQLGLGAQVTAQQDATYTVAAAAQARTNISSVPGSGPVRGAWLYNGTVYAFRDNVGATANVMYKSSPTGWQAVPMPYEIGFTAGATQINVGDTIKGGTSGATAVVRRVSVATNTWGSAATGKLVVDTITGVWQAGEPIKDSADGYVATRATTIAPIAVQVTLQPGGSYQFINYNFKGDATSYSMYGCDGVNRAFEFNGTTFVPLNTGSVPDAPSYLTASNLALWVAQQSSVMFSVPGDPTSWQAAFGAGEIACGDLITGLLALPGQAVGVYTRKTTQQVTGTSAANYVRQTISSGNGAVPGSTTVLIDAYSMDDRGITSAYTTQRYGGFEMATVSRTVQPLINSIHNIVVASIPVRRKNQYRLLMSDGRFLNMYVGGVENPYQPPTHEFTKGQYNFVPFCACSQLDVDGTERVFVGAVDGNVYELERGSTFDGQPIQAFIKVWYYNSKSPRTRKRYRRAVMEIEPAGYTSLSVFADYSYGDPTTNTATTPGMTVIGPGGQLDVASWDQFFWDAQSVAAPSVSLTGTGTNLSLVFYSNTTLDFGHTLQGAILHFTPRREQR